MGNGHVDSHAVNVQRGLADALEAAHSLEGDGLVLLAGEDKVDGTQRSFHNAAGDTEDDTCAGVVAHQILVKVLVGQTGEQNAGTLDHLGQLPGGQNSVHVLQTVYLKLVALFLVLLGGAGHDGYHENILGVDALAFGVVGLKYCTLHLVGRLAGGQVGQQVAVVVLGVIDPAGGAGGDHGEHAAVPDAA